MCFTHTLLQIEVEHTKTDFRRNNFDNSGAALIATIKYTCSLFVVIHANWLAHYMPAQKDVSVHQHNHTADNLQHFRNLIEEDPFLWQLPYFKKLQIKSRLGRKEPERHAAG